MEFYLAPLRRTLVLLALHAAFTMETEDAKWLPINEMRPSFPRVNSTVMLWKTEAGIKKFYTSTGQQHKSIFKALRSQLILLPLALQAQGADLNFLNLT